MMRNIFLSVFLMILLALLFINVYVFLYTDNADSVSFTYLMTILEEMPSIDMVFSEYVLIPKITADWSVVNGLRDFINMFINVINVLVYVGEMLINLVVWTSNFVYRLFGGVLGAISV